jgi:hypothetical protein
MVLSERSRHGIAEARRSDHGAVPAPQIRFALRSLAVALVVLGVSLGDLGPRRVVQSLGDKYESRPERHAPLCAIWLHTTLCSAQTLEMRRSGVSRGSGLSPRR